MADYFEATGIDQEAFIEDLRQQAHRSIRTRLVLEAVAKAEDIKVSPEEVAATIEALATLLGECPGGVTTPLPTAREPCHWPVIFCGTRRSKPSSPRPERLIARETR